MLDAALESNAAAGEYALGKRYTIKKSVFSSGGFRESTSDSASRMKPVQLDCGAVVAYLQLLAAKSDRLAFQHIFLKKSL